MAGNIAIDDAGSRNFHLEKKHPIKTKAVKSILITMHLQRNNYNKKYIKLTFM